MHSHPNLKQPSLWSVSSHQHQGKTLYQQQDYDLLKAQMMISIFKLKYIYYFFRSSAVSQLIGYSMLLISISYAVANKKNLCNLLYCDICFIVAVQNQTCHISEVCLYFHFHKHKTHLNLLVISHIVSFLRTQFLPLASAYLSY